jgi:photosystem II stability/assembly factor-like uncharacterized protein
VTRTRATAASLFLLWPILAGHALVCGDVLLPPAAGGFGHAYGPWRSSRIGGIGSVLGLALAPSQPGLCYAITGTATVLRTDDGGQLWRMVHGGIPGHRPADHACRSIAVDPHDPDAVLVALGDGSPGVGGLWRSADGGTTWSQVLAQPFDGVTKSRSTGSVLTFDPNTPGRVWAATCGAGVWVSEDGGIRWQPRGLRLLELSHVLVDRTNPHRVWVGATAPRTTDWRRVVRPGLWVTENEGDSWRRLYINRPCIDLVQDPLDPDVLYEARGYKGVAVSRDAGMTWHELNYGLPLNPRAASPEYTAVAVDAEEVLAAGTEGRMFRCPRGAGRWEPWSAAEPADGWAFLCADPRRAGSFWSAGPRGLWHIGRDVGPPLRPMDGIECVEVMDIVADGPVLHAATAGAGHLLSLDGAQTFHGAGEPARYLRALAVSASTPGVVYCVGGWSPLRVGVYVSLDHGRTWRARAAIGLPEQAATQIEDLAADPSQPGLVYALVTGGRDGGLYRSVDGGVSWVRTSAMLAADCRTRLPEDGLRRTVGLGPEGVIYAVVGHDSLALRISSDGGRLWRAVSLPPSLGALRSMALHPSTPGVLLLATDTGLWQSADDGRSWEALIEEPIWAAAFDERDALRIAGSSNRGIMLSTDGGLAWETVGSLPLPVGALPFWTDDRLLVGTWGSGLFWAALAGRGAKLRPPGQLPDRPAPDPSHGFPVPTVTNGDMEAPGHWGPDAWTGAGLGSGGAVVSRSPDAHSGRYSLQLETRSRGTVRVVQAIDPLPHAFRVQAYMKYQGEGFGRFGIATRDADGAALPWVPVAAVRSGDGWVAVERTVLLPRAAVRADLALMLNRPGVARLDDVSIAHP